jgi:hypothetical protein
MKYLIFIFFILINTQWLSSQETTTEIDSLYKEDQFYVGITYNLLDNKPSDIAQSGFSTGFYAGFIKDMPINNNRNIAIGVGVGYATNSFNQNILIDKDAFGNVTYSNLSGSSISYSKNKFSTQVIEIPIEFRWRTSTPTDYEFWRIYGGFKFGYMFAHTVKYNGDLGNLKYKDINDFNNFQYGLTLSAGYNTWNLYLYYGLNSIFSNDAILDGRPIDMNEIKLGLMFYIL